jgi:hemerythrin
MALPTNYRLGVTVIDFQHAQLFALIDQLTSHTGQLTDLLAGFNTYAERHFAMEEALMEAHAYPEREAHLAAHEGYRRAFEGLRGDESPVAVRAMQAFLNKWLTEHIGNVDQKLALFLKEQGMHDWA